MRTTSDHPQERKLFVLDIENLAGGIFTPEAVRDVWGMVFPFTTPFDQILVASSSRMARVALFELPMARVRYYIRSGPDGADRALLEAVDVAFAAGRFGTLVIGSGDHLFTDMAERAKAHGMRAWQLAGVGGTSRRLHAATELHARLRMTPPEVAA